MPGFPIINPRTKCIFVPMNSGIQMEVWKEILENLLNIDFNCFSPRDVLKVFFNKSGTVYRSKWSSSWNIYCTIIGKINNCHQKELF